MQRITRRWHIRLDQPICPQTHIRFADKIWGLNCQWITRLDQGWTALPVTRKILLFEGSRDVYRSMATPFGLIVQLIFSPKANRACSKDPRYYPSITWFTRQTQILLVPRIQGFARQQLNPIALRSADSVKRRSGWCLCVDGISGLFNGSTGIPVKRKCSTLKGFRDLPVNGKSSIIRAKDPKIHCQIQLMLLSMVNGFTRQRASRLGQRIERRTRQWWIRWASRIMIYPSKTNQRVWRILGFLPVKTKSCLFIVINGFTRVKRIAGRFYAPMTTRDLPVKPTCCMLQGCKSLPVKGKFSCTQRSTDVSVKNAKPSGWKDPKVFTCRWQVRVV